MYLTVFKMTRHSILESNDVLDIYSSNTMHRWLMGRQETSRKEGKVLYRIMETANEIYLYIQSKDRFNRYGVEKRGLVFVKEFDLTTLIKEGVFDFDVQTFPNQARGDYRVFLKDATERAEWLINQFAQHGMKVFQLTEYKKTTIKFDKDVQRDIPTVSFRGKVQITDIAKAEDVVFNGFGRLKNYGCGLILLK